MPYLRLASSLDNCSLLLTSLSDLNLVLLNFFQNDQFPPFKTVPQGFVACTVKLPVLNLLLWAQRPLFLGILPAVSPTPSEHRTDDGTCPPTDHHTHPILTLSLAPNACLGSNTLLLPLDLASSTHPLVLDSGCPSPGSEAFTYIRSLAFQSPTPS